MFELASKGYTNSFFNPSSTMTMIYKTSPLFHRQPLHLSRGFSLIELGLALAIIAVITGAIIKGRDLLINAKLGQVISQIQTIESAFANFESRYAGAPGDISNPSVFFENNTTNAGNGNGRIDTIAEAALAFQQLGQSNLLTGRYDGQIYTPGLCPENTCPSHALNGRIEFLINTQTQSGEPFAALLTPGNRLNTRQLAEIDRKLDDGRPNSGKFQLTQNAPENCTLVSNNQVFWNEPQQTEMCNAVLIIR
jgi:prepilin-type N-terminal cleavage/methylation domain-containing protein